MKSVILVSILLSLNIDGFSQQTIYHPFPDSNAIWSELYQPEPVDYPNIFILNKYPIVGDSLINGNTYTMVRGFSIYNNGDTEVVNSYLLYRQDVTNSKVYFWNNSVLYPYDTLIYDFSLKVGDTVNQVYGGDPHYFVKNIDSIPSPIGYLRRWEISDFFDLSEITYWIESVGNFLGFFRPPFWDPFGPRTVIVCMEANDTMIFNNLVYDSNSGELIADCDSIYSGIKEFATGASLSIFPNPATTSIQIQLSSPETTEISIFDLLGEKVKEEKVTGKQVTMDVSSLPQGLYLVRMENGVVGKFVKE